jgi:hypothetical protein
MIAGCVTARTGADAPPDAAATAPRLVVPPADAVGVPTNLRRVIVAAPSDPGPLALAPAGVRTAALSGPLTCGAPACAGLELETLLLPNAHYEVVAGTARLPFQTGSGPDLAAPTVRIVEIVAEGRCALLRAAADEPVTVELRDARGRALATRDVAALDVEISAVAGQGPELILAVTDLAGHFTGTSIPYTPTRDPAPLVITEVLSHPKGPQPAQEWVELHNVGSSPLATDGFVLTAASGSDPLPAAFVPGGGFALVVPAGFSPDDGVDARPAPGAALLRLGSTTLGKGLPDGAGVPVELRDGAAQLVSRYGGYIDTSPHGAAGTSAARVADEACDARSAWRPSRPPTPGAPNQ